jgi:hypothetical protein
MNFTKLAVCIHGHTADGIFQFRRRYVALWILSEFRLAVGAAEQVRGSGMDFPQASLRVYDHSTNGIVYRLRELVVVLRLLVSQLRIRTHASSPIDSSTL